MFVPAETGLAGTGSLREPVPECLFVHELLTVLDHDTLVVLVYALTGEVVNRAIHFLGLRYCCDTGGICLVEEKA